jgi:hypothetical protein
MRAYCWRYYIMWDMGQAESEADFYRYGLRLEERTAGRYFPTGLWAHRYAQRVLAEAQAADATFPQLEYTVYDDADPYVDLPADKTEARQLVAEGLLDPEWRERCVTEWRRGMEP